MKKSDLKPGTKVIASMDYDYTIVRFIPNENYDLNLVGLVQQSYLTGNKVLVKWIGGDFTDAEQEVEASILSLASDQSDLEKEYKLAVKEVKNKMKEAGKIIKEANTMAKKAGAENLASMYDAVHPLVDAMDASGWRSSSWDC